MHRLISYIITRVRTGSRSSSSQDREKGLRSDIVKLHYREKGSRPIENISIYLPCPILVDHRLLVSDVSFAVYITTVEGSLHPARHYDGSLMLMLMRVHVTHHTTDHRHCYC